MLPTIDVPEPIEQTASGRAGVPAAGAAAAAGSGGRGGGAATPTSGFAGVGGGASGLPLKLLSMSLPLVLVGIPAIPTRRDTGLIVAQARDIPDKPWPLPPGARGYHRARRLERMELQLSALVLQRARHCARPALARRRATAGLSPPKRGARRRKRRNPQNGIVRCRSGSSQ